MRRVIITSTTNTFHLLKPKYQQQIIGWQCQKPMLLSTANKDKMVEQLLNPEPVKTEKPTTLQTLLLKFTGNTTTTTTQKNIEKDHGHSHGVEEEHDDHAHSHSHSHSHSHGEHATIDEHQQKQNQQILEDDPDDYVEMWNENAPAGREWNGPRGLEPTRYGNEWEQKGRVSDFS
jgi:hypothetical protein